MQSQQPVKKINEYHSFVSKLVALSVVQGVDCLSNA